jgi:hypothetical protein
MYSWLWRHLPLGLAGKIGGSVLLLAAVAALLWYSIFPNIEQYMPFTDGQVTSSDGSDSVSTGGDPSLPPPDVIPYSTVSNAPAPKSTR